MLRRGCSSNSSFRGARVSVRTRNPGANSTFYLDSGFAPEGAPRNDGPVGSSGDAVQCGKALLLLAVGGEIVGRKPALEGGLAHRPFAVEHGKPGVVAVAAL